MHIGILTFYFADNYGAVLQCYALQKYIQSKGHDVYVIPYKPFKMIPMKARVRSFFFHNVQEKKFINFRERYLNIKKLKKYDLVIVGSDQVWNPDIIFCDKHWINPKCEYDEIIAYAVSFGKSFFSLKDKKFFLNNRKNLERYKKIGVREKEGMDLLKEFEINSEVVCDPTLLLLDNVIAYDEIAKFSEYDIGFEYVLVYALEKSEELNRIITKIKNSSDIIIIAIHPMNVNYCNVDQFIYDAGPSEFLDLIKNANMVITNSFHGLVFSLIYHKKVISITSEKLGTRQKQLYEWKGQDIRRIGKNSVEISADVELNHVRNMVLKSETYIMKNVMCGQLSEE